MTDGGERCWTGGTEAEDGGIPCPGRLEDLAHWTDGGDLVDAAVDIAHVGGGWGRRGTGVSIHIMK